MIIENGNILSESAQTVVGGAQLGNQVFVLQGPRSASQGMSWLAISHSADANGNYLSGEQTLQRLRASDDFMKVVQEKMHPGMTVVLTDAPLHPDTRTGKDFVIMS